MVRIVAALLATLVAANNYGCNDPLNPIQYESKDPAFICIVYSYNNTLSRIAFSANVDDFTSLQVKDLY